MDKDTVLQILYLTWYNPVPPCTCEKHSRIGLLAHCGTALSSGLAPLRLAKACPPRLSESKKVERESERPLPDVHRPSPRFPSTSHHYL